MKTLNKETDVHYPRILLHGYSFDGNTCYGVTTNGLFGGWPKEKLAAIGGIEHFPKDSVINEYYCLGEEEEKWIFPLSLIPMSARRKSGPRYPETVLTLRKTGNDNDGEQSSSKDAGKIKKCWQWIMDCLDGEELLRKRRLSAKMRRWVNDFQPDVIYTILGSLNNIRFANSLADLTGASLAVHIMDDWPTTLHTKGIFSISLRKKMLREFRAILERASVRLAISQAMCDEYKKRYDLDFQPFYNPIDLKVWENVSRNEWTARKPFRFVYTGRIGVANAQSLKDMALAIKSLHGQGYDICLEIYSSDFQKPDFANLIEKNVIDLLPPVSHDRIPALLANADGLVLPLDFDEQAQKYARFSIPTKASEYMASSTPVLVYAPANTAVSDYARNDGWGYMVSKKSKVDLKQAILQLMGNQTLRKQLGTRAYQLAIRNHDSEKVQEAFRRTLATPACNKL